MSYILKLSWFEMGENSQWRAFPNKNLALQIISPKRDSKSTFSCIFEYFISQITRELQMALKCWYEITLNFSLMKINDQIKVDL